MLAADKLLLQTTVKQRAIQLREKELNLFNKNFSAVGAQAAIMAGFTLTTFVEIDLPPNKPTAKTMLHTFVTISICANLVCVATVTFVSVWGSGKALRGKDGSMDIAVEGMNAERTLIFAAFAIGTLACLGCLFSAAWVLMETEVRRSPLPAPCAHARHHRATRQSLRFAHPRRRRPLADRDRRLGARALDHVPRLLRGAAHPQALLPRARRLHLV